MPSFTPANVDEARNFAATKSQRKGSDAKKTGLVAVWLNRKMIS
jgi:hypothetical protein